MSTLCVLPVTLSIRLFAFTSFGFVRKSGIKSLEWEIAEGNFSHLLSIIDKVIVLRCDPAVLINRLKERNYSSKKIIIYFFI